MTELPLVLDPASGSRMFYFDKDGQAEVFARARGAERNQRAREIYLECRTRDEWPAYPGITTVQIPA